MAKLRCILLAVISFGVLPFLGGCNAVILNPKGLIAQQELHLLIIAVLLMLIIVVPVLVLTLVIARRYRASANATYTPDWAHNNWLEAVWWAIPIAIIAVLATITWVSTHKLDPYKPLDVGGKPLKIQVIALQWRWLFIYPEQNIATVNFIEFPANRQVEFDITADAPMNAFQIPQLGSQIYAMAGMQTKLHLIANEPGDYKGRSVSFSGDGFSDMKFIARATSDTEFEQWVASVKNAPNQLSAGSYSQLAKANHDEKRQYFSSVQSNLYHDIIQKYMEPAQKTVASASNIVNSN